MVGPNGTDEMAHFVNSAVLPVEEAADLLASVEAARFFWTLEFAETSGCILASYDAYLSVACSLSDFVMGVMSAFSPSRRNRRKRLVVDARTCS